MCLNPGPIEQEIFSDDTVTMVSNYPCVVEELEAPGVCNVDACSHVSLNEGVVDSNLPCSLIDSYSGSVLVVADFAGVKEHLVAHVLDIDAIACIIGHLGVDQPEIIIGF